MDNSNRRIIQMLDAIPKFETQSQCSSNLEKVFQENSFKFLLKHLREQKKPKIYSYFNVDEKKPETNNIFQAYGIENKREEANYNILNDNPENDIKNNEKDENLKKDTWKIPIIQTKRRYNPDLDPFRYNPNYNSIYKNIPSVRITLPMNETFSLKKYEKKIKNNKKPKNFIQSPFLTEIGDKAISTTFTDIGKRPKNFDFKNIGNMKLLKNNKKIKILNENDRNNHSIRFDKYVNRKELKTDFNLNISYIEPYDYQKVKNNSIDFSKMRSRNEIPSFNSDNLKGPSIGYYEPNYNYFEIKPRNISLGNESLKEKNKKYLLKKLWASYKVRVDYQLIDNNKLKNTISKDLV